MFNSSVIEYLLTFTMDNLNKRYFMFKLNVEENSLIQINLTGHTFNNEGKMVYYHSTEMRIKPFDADEIKKIIKNVPAGIYYIEWRYTNNDPPKEILFCLCYQGKIKLDFVGMSEQSQINNYSYNFNSRTGLFYKKNSYKLSEKLGEFYQRKANTCEFIKKTYGFNINAEEEDKGYRIDYQENDNIAFTYILNKEDYTKIKILSQNLDFQELIFEGNKASSGRIVDQGKVYRGNELVYQGKINYNLIPQFVSEDNNNRLIVEVTEKRLKFSQDIKEDALINMNVRIEGPFDFQLKLPTHPHGLTLCKTPERKFGWICDHCTKSFDKNKYSYYCSECDYDFCGNDFCVPEIALNERTPHIDKDFHFKSLQHKHPLVKIEINYWEYGRPFKCFSCLKGILKDEKFYCCTVCDFRLCLKCKINETRGEPWQFHTSWHDHPLTFCKTKGKYREIKYSKTSKEKFEILDDYDFYFICNHCGIEYSRKKDTFYCTACDFYICMKCYKNYFYYEGRDVENVVKVHMGTKAVLPVYCRCFLSHNSTQFVDCKKCNCELRLSDWTYYCSNCNSNFCRECYRFHKVLFKNNILVFDGYFKGDLKQGLGVTYKVNNEINFIAVWENGIFPLMKNIEHNHSFNRRFFNFGTKCNICCEFIEPFSGSSCWNCALYICDQCIMAINKILIKSIFNDYNVTVKKYKEQEKCNYCKEKKSDVFFDIIKKDNKIIILSCLACFLSKFK